MKNPISKSNRRRPLKVILIILLLLIVSYTFISSVTQFFIVNREIDRIGSYYKSIGTIQPYEEDQYYINEARSIIADDPMIEDEDSRRFGQGIIEGLPNPYIEQEEFNFIQEYENLYDYQTFLGDIIFTAEVNDVYQALTAESIYDEIRINVTIEEKLAGFPDFIGEGERHSITVAARSLKTGEVFDFISDEVIDDLMTLEIGETYAFRTYWDHALMGFTMIQPIYTDGPLYEKVEDKASIDWDDPKWNRLKQDIDIINENIYSYTLITTKDMTNIPIFQEVIRDHYLKEGRLINRNDDLNQNYVCVINERFAGLRGINIGDELELQMRDIGGFISSAEDHKNWQTYHTSEPISFEVVGIFSRIENVSMYGVEIYIPNSTMPEEFGHYYTQDLDEPDYYSGNYSFTLKNSQDEAAFIDKYEQPLEEIGYSLYFIESNAVSFWNAANPIIDSALISFVIFALLLLLTQAFVVYLYVDGHKLNYAIERALGISAKESGLHLSLPLLIYGSIASIVGGFLGYYNAVDESAELLADIAEISQVPVSSTLELRYFLLFIIGVLILFIAMLLINIFKLKKASIINLINNHGNKRKKKNKKGGPKQEVVDDLDETGFDLTTLDEIGDDENLVKDPSNSSALNGYSKNHALRAKVSSILLIMLSGIFVFSLLWMNYLIVRNNETIDKAYSDTVVTGDIVTNQGEVTGAMRGPISGSHIDNFLDTGLVEDYVAVADMYYTDLFIERDGVEFQYDLGIEEDPLGIPKKNFKVMASNTLYNTEEGFEISNLDIIDGYSLDDFFKEYNLEMKPPTDLVILDEEGRDMPILASERAMRDYELELGDRIAVFEEPRRKEKIFGTVVGTFYELNLIKKHEYIEMQGERISDEFTMFVYPLSALKIIEKDNVFYHSISLEFNTETNKDLLVQKEKLKEMVLNNENDVHLNELVLWDGELINVVEPLEKNLSLLEILYPVTLIVSIIIAGILSFMMILRRTLDVAILRVLGVKEKDVKKSLFMENIILVLIGILISVGIMQLITIDSYAISLASYGIVIGGYILGNIIGLTLSIRKVTNKKPLEMLQVRE